jgi:hypothetical protein
MLREHPANCMNPKIYTLKRNVGVDEARRNASARYLRPYTAPTAAITHSTHWRFGKRP